MSIDLGRNGISGNGHNVAVHSVVAIALVAAIAGITSIPGGGAWAIGVKDDPGGNYDTLIMYHP